MILDFSGLATILFLVFVVSGIVSVISLLYVIFGKQELFAKLSFASIFFSISIPFAYGLFVNLFVGGMYFLFYTIITLGFLFGIISLIRISKNKDFRGKNLTLVSLVLLVLLLFYVVF